MKNNHVLRKVTMSVALLAMVGGLAGCGSNSAQTHHSHTQQSAQQAKSNNPYGNLPPKAQTAQAVNDAFGNVPGWVTSKYNVSTDSEDQQSDPVVLGFDTPSKGQDQLDNIQEHKDHDDPETDDGHDPEPLAHFTYTPQHDMQKFWSFFYGKLKDQGVTNKKPVKILFHYTLHSPETRKNTKYYLVYTAMSNSPKLKGGHMKQLKPYRTTGGGEVLPNE